jgi:SAM-dependent methyltransferase
MSIAEHIRDYWDTDSATYDHAANHRPTSAAERSAWAAALARLLPPPPARVLDCGAGTGFLSLIAARLGHKVTAVDVSTGMLDRLRARAASEGLGVDVVEGSASEPPGGPYDAVIERHLLWTLPDPVAALRAWRGVAPVGRLILVEGLWGSADPIESWRSRGRRLVRQFRGGRPEHHAEYPDQVRAALPFGRGTHPSAVVQAALDAGWPDPWLERLRDVEWAASLELPLAERLFGVPPRFVVTAG